MLIRIVWVAAGVLLATAAGCKTSTEPQNEGDCAGLADGTACGDTAAIECTIGGTCQNGACVTEYADLGTSCGSPEVSECDGADLCDGYGNCLTNRQLEGTACGDSTNAACNAADTCDAQGQCNANHAAEGTTCGDDTVTECSLADTCDGEGACAGNHSASGTACGDSADNECADPDTCDGVGNCNANDAPLGSACGDATINECTGADFCDGETTCLDNDIAVAADPWWNAAYESRAPVVIKNSTLSTLSSTTNVSFSFDHASLVTAGTSQADGSDVRLVYYKNEASTEIGRVVVNNWNQSTTTIAFALADPISGNESSTGYWLYYNGPSGGTPEIFAPSVQLDGWAIGATDASDLLTCDEQKNPDYSVQFRQVGRTTFEARIYDATFDAAANAEVTVTDSNASVLFNNTYGDYGDIITSGQHVETITFTPTTTFTVTATSQETTQSTRYLGCEEHVTTDNVEGTTSKQYTLASESLTHPARVCDLGE